MAVTTIPNVTNWSVTPQNGQAGYFTLMNTWLSESTAVIGSLQAAITAQNTANSEINDLAIQTENNAIVANGLANYIGIWSNAVTYSKGQSVSSGTLYYISLKNNNLNNAVTNPTYWLPSPINTKVDYNMSGYTPNATPVDADLIPLSDSTASFGIKKLTWANLKATILSSFGVMISTATAKTTPVDADIFIIGDSNSSNASKKTTWANLKTAIISSFGVMINTLTAKTTLDNADIFTIGDSANSNASKKISWANLIGNIKNIAYKSTPVTINSWSYSTTTITLNVTSHTFVAGDYIEVSGLTATTYAPNGIFLVTSVTATTIVFTQAIAPTGTAGVSSATVKGYTTINGRVSESIGVNQTWQNVTASRALSTTYTNTTGKPILVAIITNGTVANTSTSLLIDGTTRVSFGIGNSILFGGTLMAIIPNGSTYSVTSNNPISAWHELR